MRLRFIEGSTDGGKVSINIAVGSAAAGYEIDGRIVAKRETWLVMAGLMAAGCEKTDGVVSVDVVKHKVPPTKLTSAP